jgi:predicted phage terminase large subunit-like protein
LSTSNLITSPVDFSADQMLALARNDLACYCTAQWPQFEMAAHHRVILERLEAVERGEIRRLMLFLPPRHGKSLLTSQFFPAWYLGHHPDRDVIFITYGQELSDDFGRRGRNLIAEPLHQAVFAGCSLSEDSTAAHRFNTTRGGAYFAVGRGGPITGRGANLLIVDDPLKDREEANSETIRKNLHEWFASVAYTRLVPSGAVILVQTRWHEDDLAGWLLRKHADDGWEIVSLPAIAEADESFRSAGEALWPQRFSLDALQQIRQAVGSATWESLYQQRPAAAEGALFKRNWWRYYREHPACSRIVQSWDTAFKKGSESDYSVCTTWGVTDNGYYLLAFWRGRVEFPELKRNVTVFSEEWNPDAILVEDRASGQSLIQEMQAGTILPIIPVKVDSDKISRAQAVTPLIEAGRVYLPETAAWLRDFVDELSVFPKGTHDDIVDSVTQALNYLREKPTPGFCILGGADKDEADIDKEALWEKVMRGEPLSEAEIDRL